MQGQSAPLGPLSAALWVTRPHKQMFPKTKSRETLSSKENKTGHTRIDPRQEMYLMKTCSWNSLFPLVTILVRFKLSSVCHSHFKVNCKWSICSEKTDIKCFVLYSKPEKVNKSHTTFSFNE
jgi:hypothetical protein